ncbi:MAG: hypothetical protein AAGG68_09220 [Bacteroidota bacterium]
MPRNTIQELQSITNQFFQLHLKNVDPPIWSEPWNFIGGIPKGDCQGCYATFNQNEELTYIGVGISFTKGRYEKHGLGRRLKRFYKVDVRDYKDASNTTFKRRDPVNAYYIRTLPFEKDYAYLAAAFEVYTILNLEGLNNVVHNKR